MVPQIRSDEAIVLTLSKHIADQGSLPPLDEVTVYSASTSDECDASVSSIEDLDDYANRSIMSPTRPKRSLFGSYWEKKGGAPSLHRAPLEDDDSCSTSSINTYERTLKTTERKASHSQKALRFASDPALNLRLLDSSQVRKTRSTSALHQRPRGSCLRPSRFASDNTVKPEPMARAKSAPEASVSFSPQVDVVVFQLPTEFWAKSGWSNYYAN